MKPPPSIRIVLLLLLAPACAVDELEESTTAQAGINMQGINMQGINMQGINMQGINMQGFALGGATLSGQAIDNLHVEAGELVGIRSGVAVRGTALAGTHLFASGTDAAGAPVQVEYRISAVQAELASYDPTHTGSTYLYSLDQWVTDTSTWSAACSADADGRRVAIPVASTFDAQGDRVYVPGMFTFGCTTGVIAKCYRWGYRPWVAGYGNLDDMHWTCTRLARADYCGDGTSHTHEGTRINVWDKLPAPGPIQKHGGLLPPLGMIFEAGWDTHGAVCLSRGRWLLDGGLLASLCPDRLVPLGLLGATVCDTVGEVLGQHPNALMFNESPLLNLF
ncbi:MAG: ADYC domain-containing protein [Kofleriaceae bacterium]